MRFLSLTLFALVAAMTLSLGAATAAEHEGKPQTTCPVMDGEINKDLYADHDGKRVYFCCPMCKPKFEADPQKYIDKLEADGVKIEKAPSGPANDSEKEKLNRSPE